VVILICHLKILGKLKNGNVEIIFRGKGGHIEQNNGGRKPNDGKVGKNYVREIKPP